MVSNAAVTPQLTMIAGAGNFPSGRFRCETSFLDLNVTWENAESSFPNAKNAKKACKKGLKNISWGCDRSEFITRKFFGIPERQAEPPVPL
jgi:hypothetical protein